MKSIFACLLLTAVVGIVPLAQAAQTVELTMAGSSGAWQSLGVGTYNYCQTGGVTCFHWTSASNVVNLTDSRVTPVNVDPGTLWVVWSVVGGNVAKVWSDDKVDTIVGNRCFFAQPQCSVSATLSSLSGSGSTQIAASIWGSDTALPSSVISVFTSGTLVNAVATDVRPEDAAFESCRVNSLLGAGS
jgi:predicted transglutaminase-like cysteine proteinase